MESPSLSLPCCASLREGGGPGAGTRGRRKHAEEGRESRDRGPTYRSHGGRREPTVASDPPRGCRTALGKVKAKVREPEGEERAGQTRAGGEARKPRESWLRAGERALRSAPWGKPFPPVQAAPGHCLIFGGTGCKPPGGATCIIPPSVRFGRPLPQHGAPGSALPTELAGLGLYEAARQKSDPRATLRKSVTFSEKLCVHGPALQSWRRPSP